MKLDREAIGAGVAFIQEEVRVLSATLREKGLKRFERPLLLAALFVGGSYYLSNRPLRQMKALDGRLQEAKLIARNAEAFQQARQQIAQATLALPKAGSKDHFLQEAVVETLAAAGLTSDSLPSPEQTTDNGLIYQKITVSMEAKFAEVVALLARLEAAKPLLHVSSLSVAKSSRLGYCTVQVGIGTIIPEKDLGR